MVCEHRFYSQCLLICDTCYIVSGIAISAPILGAFFVVACEYLADDIVILQWFFAIATLGLCVFNAGIARVVCANEHIEVCNGRYFVFELTEPEQTNCYRFYSSYCHTVLSFGIVCCGFVSLGSTYPHSESK
jgi:hypothetical protein